MICSNIEHEDSILMKIKQVIGTAHFGLKNYGVANFYQKKNFQIINILEKAYESGIKYFDTAPEYNSEKILGEFCKMNKLQKKIKIITKIPNLIASKNYRDQALRSIEKSMKSLNVENIFCILMHNQFDINRIVNDENFFLKIRKEFNIKKFGFSVYDLNVTKKILNIFPNASLQFPYNIVNNDFKGLNKNKNLFFGRSIFLQGFLINEKIKKMKKNLLESHKEYFDYVKNKKINPLELCLDYSYANKNLDFIVYGVNNVDQLKKITNYNPRKKINANIIKKINSFFKKDKLDPRSWNMK